MINEIQARLLAVISRDCTFDENRKRITLRMTGNTIMKLSKLI